MSLHSAHSVGDIAEMEDSDVNWKERCEDSIEHSATAATARERRKMERDMIREEHERKRLELLMIQEEEEKRARELQKVIQAREKEIEALDEQCDTSAEISGEEVESTHEVETEEDIDNEESEHLDETGADKGDSQRKDETQQIIVDEEGEKDNDVADASYANTQNRRDSDIQRVMKEDDYRIAIGLQEEMRRSIEETMIDDALQRVHGPAEAERKLQMIEREKKKVSLAAQAALEELDKEALKTLKKVKGLSQEGEEEKRALEAKRRQEDEKDRRISEEMKWKEEKKKLLERQKQYMDSMKILEEEKEIAIQSERMKRMEAEKSHRILQDQNKLLQAKLKDSDSLRKKKRLLPIPQDVRHRQQTSDKERIGHPIDSSTDIDEEKEDEKELKRNLSWIDKKFKQVVKENTEVHEPKPATVTSKGGVLKSIKAEQTSFQRKDTSLVLPVRPKLKTVLDKPVKQEDDVERQLREKVERMQKKEEELAVRIRKAKVKKEEDEHRLREKTLREERIRKLKEQEQTLVESLYEKESELSALEISKNEKPVTKSVSKDEVKKDSSSLKKENPVKKTDLKDREKKKIESSRAAEKERTMSFKKPTIPKLTEDTFEEWKIEVEVILKSGLYHEDVIRQEVRNSLCGNTRKLLLNMDPGASTKELITKLENTYGNIRSGESVLGEFYNAQQRDDETSAQWGIRVESILNMAIKKGQVQRSQADEMLRNRFWRHLRSHQLKNATRVFFETEHDFEALRKKVRIEENELKASKENEKREKYEYKHATSQQRTDDNEQSSLMRTLLQRMEKLEKEIAKQSDTSGKKDTASSAQGVTESDRREDIQRDGNYSQRGGYNNRNRNWNRGGYRRGYGFRRNRGNYNPQPDRNSQEERENTGRENEQYDRDSHDPREQTGSQDSRKDDNKKGDTRDNKQGN